jgi:hypothetical protein
MAGCCGCGVWTRYGWRWRTGGMMETDGERWCGALSQHVGGRRWILPLFVGFGGINGFWTPFLTFEGQILNGSNLIQRN